MSEPGTICPKCAANVPAGIRFCGSCGASLDVAPAAARPAMKTMLGLDAEAVRAATEAIRNARAQAGAAPAPAPDKKPAAPISEAGKRALNQTMLGFAGDIPRPNAAQVHGGAPPSNAQPPELAAAGTAEPRPDAQDSASSAGEARPSAPPMAAARRSTPPLSGQAAGLPRGIAPPRGTWSDAPPQPADPAPKPAGPLGTMLGMSAVSQAALASAPQNPAAQPITPGLPPASAPLSAQFGSTRAAGTMLGMSAPLPASPSQPASDRPGAAGAAHGRTMLGVPLASLNPPAGAQPSAAQAPQPDAASVMASSSARGAWAGSGESADAFAARGSQAPAAATRPLWPLVLGVLAIIALAGMLVVRLTSRTAPTDVTARIVSAPSGESLLFEVPGAPDGSRLRFGGQEQPLNAGRASFPLAADSLRVGDNVVLADVVKPNGETTSARITLAVFYRIWVDTAALRADRSALDVVVTALPGTHVTLEGEELKLDAQGRATRSFPLDVAHQAKAGVIEHVVHYRMQPPSGETVVDELHTQIPLAMMQIDRPGMEVVTDRESIEIAGAVGRDTQVRVDDAEVPVKDQRFLYSFPLPKPGDYQPRVVASAAGKAPLGVTLHIRRVHDLAQAAREFVPDPNLTYAKLAPNPTIYRGQSIALEGRVYAFDARAGSSVIQMLVRPCPSSQRCSLWVVDPQASEVAVDHWVRVLGTVDGEQQFRSEKNEVVTVPKIVARFILPAKP
jgi:hypothetical protein